MKQLVIVSGKGGTGKTTLCASLVELAKDKVIADCDVEAPNLHLLLESKVIREKEYYGSKTAEIDEKKCLQCGRCTEVCRFKAIENFQVNDFKCEGCAACVYVCPVNAVKLLNTVTGKTVLSRSKAGTFSHARLNIGADGSGKLVTEVRKNALASAEQKDLVLIDGSPGIGCVVIASITGCDAILAVSEPTVSGKHDLARILELANHFGIRAYVCINKFDLNPAITGDIIRQCEEANVRVLGKVPFDREVNKSLAEGIPVVNIPHSIAGIAIRGIWDELQKIL